jgi:hypothetical protein
MAGTLTIDSINPVNPPPIIIQYWAWKHMCQQTFFPHAGTDIHNLNPDSKVTLVAVGCHGYVGLHSNTYSFLLSILL